MSMLEPGDVTGRARSVVIGDGFVETAPPDERHSNPRVVSEDAACLKAGSKNGTNGDFSLGPLSL